MKRLIEKHHIKVGGILFLMNCLLGNIESTLPKSSIRSILGRTRPKSIQRSISRNNSTEDSVENGT